MYRCVRSLLRNFPLHALCRYVDQSRSSVARFNLPLYRIRIRYFRGRQDWYYGNCDVLLVLHRHLLLAYSQQLTVVVYWFGLDPCRQLDDAKCRQYQLGLHWRCRPGICCLGIDSFHVYVQPHCRLCV